MPSAFNNERVAFLIGQDFARYGLRAPEKAETAFMQGYTEGVSHSQALKADRFVRKWLQVRFNAWKRNRFVDNAFTPEFLHSIAQQRCPVSEVEFTYGTGADTDWSVDRIDNDGGYTPRNIMLVTTRVNKAKGLKSIMELLMQGHPLTDPTLLAGGLTSIPSAELTILEWRRIAWFAGTCEKHMDYPVREEALPSAHAQYLLVPWCCWVQRFIVMVTAISRTQRDAVWDDFRSRSVGVEGQERLERLRNSISRYARDTPVGSRSAANAFNDNERWEQFASWWIWLAQTRELKGLIDEISKSKQLQLKLISVDEFCGAKQSATKGFA